MEEEAISEESKIGPSLAPLTLVLGGARSGKSLVAEKLIRDSGNGTYIATAEARDAEMRRRIDQHQNRRGPAWHNIEALLDLISALTEAEELGHPVLVDCLTLWLANLMEADRDIGKETDSLTTRLTGMTCPVVMVSNEVGQGIVPANALARRFRDHAGVLNQAMAACADRVYVVTAGIPTQLK